MIPILYGRNEKLFRSNGICRLVDCISCLVTEERNGTYECEFEYPITGKDYDKIQEGCIIYTTHDHTKTPQPFDIYKRSAPIDGIVTFYASHISYRLNSIILEPFEAVSCAQALSFFASHSVNDNPFTFWTDKDVSGPYAVDVPANIREKLCGEQGSILDVYGTGEYEFDKWDVKLYVNRGQDTSVSIRYGKNLVDITNEVDTSGIYNAVAPFWKNNETGDVVTLPEYYLYESSAPLNLDAWTEQHGDIITEEDSVNIEFGVQTPQIIALDLSEEFEEQPTVEELRDKAAARLANSGAWLPRQNIELDFVNLCDTYDYSGRGIERLNLCDTAEVIYTELGVNVRQKVIKTVYNSLLEKYDSMELGSARQTFAEALESIISGHVAENYSRKSAMVSAIERATNLITGGLGGHVIIGMDDGTPNEILIMDTEDKATAVNVLRINQAGIGFSSHGYGGPFDTAWTLDGHFVADYITSGTLDATLLKAGTITDDLGYNYWDLETGEFRLSSTAKIDNAQTVGNLQSVASGAQTAASNAQTTATNAQTTATNAATAAANAQTAVTNLDNSLDTTGVFNRLTNNGTLQGLYMQNGELYVNASYIQAGTLSADLIKTGILQNTEGTTYWNLGTGILQTTGEHGYSRIENGLIRIYSPNGSVYGSMGVNTGIDMQTPSNVISQAVIRSNKGVMLFDDSDGTAFILEPTAFVVDGVGYKVYSGGGIYSNGAICDYSGYYIREGNTNANRNTVFSITKQSNADNKSINIKASERLILSDYNNNGTITINGRDSFTDKITISGRTHLSSYTTLGGDLYGLVNITCSHLTQISDERKKNFLPWNPAYDSLIDDLTPQLFTWKEGGDDTENIGFSAQKVKKALEDRGITESGIVHEDEDGYLSLNYNSLTLLLFNRVKKQDAEIKQLNDRIATLERMVQNLCKSMNCPQ